MRNIIIQSLTLRYASEIADADTATMLTLHVDITVQRYATGCVVVMAPGLSVLIGVADEKPRAKLDTWLLGVKQEDREDLLEAIREAVERIEPCCIKHPRPHYKSLPQAVGYCDDASL